MMQQDQTPLTLDDPALALRFELASADFFWVPDDVQVVTRDEIAYTAAARGGVLFNSVAYVRAAEPGLAQALVDEVSTAHRGQASRWMLSPHADNAALTLALEAAGYTALRGLEQRVIAVDAYDARAADAYTAIRVSILAQLEASYATMARAFEREEHRSTPGELVEELERCNAERPRVARFNVVSRQSGEVVSSGGLTLDHNQKVGFLWAGGTAPGHRGQGAYTTLLRARVDVARASGLSHVGLFAVTDTSAPIVERQGFASLGVMSEWRREP